MRSPRVSKRCHCCSSCSWAIFLRMQRAAKSARPIITGRQGQNPVLHFLHQGRGVGRGNKVALLPLREDNFLSEVRHKLGRLGLKLRRQGLDPDGNGYSDLKADERAVADQRPGVVPKFQDKAIIQGMAAHHAWGVHRPRPRQWIILSIKVQSRPQLGYNNSLLVKL